VLEYVRLGIPVVATWTPTVAYYFPEGTLTFVRDATPAGVADALKRVLTAPDEARQGAARAQELPIARAWQEGAPAFLRFVEEAAAAHES
jgi:glycosyltransferase involved in cell wall biosynthesis